MLWILESTIFDQWAGSSEHPKQLYDLMDKELILFCANTFCLSCSMLCSKFQSIYVTSQIFFSISASIMMPPNGTHPMLPQPKLDSPSYYNYSPHPQDPQQHMVPMHPGMPNGQSQLSPSGNPHKRRKHGGMSSISSTDDDVESVGDDTEHMSNYYGKSPASMSSQSSGWQEQPMDPGTLCGVVQPAASVCVTKVYFLKF